MSRHENGELLDVDLDEVAAAVLEAVCFDSSVSEDFGGSGVWDVAPHVSTTKSEGETSHVLTASDGTKWVVTIKEQQA